MSRNVVYVCDGCGRERRETNRWFSLSLLDKAAERTLEIGHFPGPPPAQHYCGEACLQAAISRALSNGFDRSAGREQHEPSGINRFFGRWPGEETDDERQASCQLCDEPRLVADWPYCEAHDHVLGD